MIRIGIVGMGVIGTAIAKAASGDLAGIELAGVAVRDPAKAGGCPACPLDELIHRSDLIVEAATQAALREFGPAVLTAGKHLMVLSVGALAGVLGEWARPRARSGRAPASSSHRAPSPASTGSRARARAASTRSPWRRGSRRVASPARPTSRRTASISTPSPRRR